MIEHGSRLMDHEEVIVNNVYLIDIHFKPDGAQELELNTENGDPIYIDPLQLRSVTE